MKYLYLHACLFHFAGSLDKRLGAVATGQCQAGQNDRGQKQQGPKGRGEEGMGVHDKRGGGRR